MLLNDESLNDGKDNTSQIKRLELIICYLLQGSSDGGSHHYCDMTCSILLHTDTVSSLPFEI